VIKMAEIIAGSPEKLRQRPFISMVTCNISPFMLDESYGQLAIEVARQGIPVVVPVEPLCGATAPITLYGCISSITDLRDMKYLSGAIEMGLMNAASAQMANFYNLPLYSTAGMSDSKINDSQSGYESALTGLMVALAGGNFIHDAAGFLEFCMTASYDKLVIDNEIIGMIMRAVEGITVDEETLAFDTLENSCAPSSTSPNSATGITGKFGKKKGQNHSGFVLQKKSGKFWNDLKYLSSLLLCLI
jgi:trimethylamine--corrinoid protein Co-methyltransferase